MMNEMYGRYNCLSLDISRSMMINTAEMHILFYYVLLYAGELLKTLQSEKIQPSWGQISIYRDMLAVACPYQDMFQLFRLT